MEIGVDLVEINRFKKLITNQRLLQKIFSKEELNYAFARSYPQQHLAVRFAAKEAFIKAFGIRVPFKEIEIKNNDAGKPLLFLRGKFVPKAMVTLTHTSTLALAIVVIEGGEKSGENCNSFRDATIR